MGLFIPELPKILQSVKEVLEGMPRKQAHIKDIAHAALSKNVNLNLSADEFAAKAGAALAAHVKRKTDIVFTRVPSKKDEKGKPIAYKKGVYRLRIERGAKSPLPMPVAPPADSGFVGKAGELAVMSELLFWGYNASLMTVDKGVDIITEKGGNYYHIQVKTALQRADKRYLFTIKKSAFEANARNNTYYAFVMRAPTGNRFAIVPSVHLQTQLKLGHIKDGDTLSISISHNDKENHFSLNSRDNITPFIGNFGIIE